MNLLVTNRWSARATAMTADRKTPTGAISKLKSREAQTEMAGLTGDDRSVKRKQNKRRCTRRIFRKMCGAARVSAQGNEALSTSGD